MDICVAVAAHKKYWMPQDEVYLPLQAGAALHEPLGYTRDDEGENISKKNASFCELTVLYWLWKHCEAEYIGLCHYRRYFASRCTGDKKSRILTEAQLKSLLEQAPVLLPKPRNYFIETNYSQYVHAHHEQDLTVTRQILEQRWPEYLPAWDKRMGEKKGHRFNMFVMRRDLFREYCAWLFDILFVLEDRLDTTGYDAYSGRVFGFVGERLLDAWLDTKKLPCREVASVNLENQHWIKKGSAFLWRKFGRKTQTAGRTK